MKQFVRCGIFLLAAACTVQFSAVTAQKDRSAHDCTGTHELQKEQAGAQITQTSGERPHHKGPSIAVRKFKPRSTQPSRLTDILIVKDGMPNIPESKSAVRTNMRRIIVSRLLVPVTDLKHAHTLNEQKIFVIFNQYKNFFTA